MLWPGEIGIHGQTIHPIASNHDHDPSLKYDYVVVQSILDLYDIMAAKTEIWVCSISGFSKKFVGDSSLKNLRNIINNGEMAAPAMPSIPSTHRPRLRCRVLKGIPISCGRTWNRTLSWRHGIEFQEIKPPLYHYTGILERDPKL